MADVEAMILSARAAGTQSFDLSGVSDAQLQALFAHLDAAAQQSLLAQIQQAIATQQADAQKLATIFSFIRTAVGVTQLFLA